MFCLLALSPLLGTDPQPDIWTTREVVKLLLKTVVPALVTGAGLMWAILRHVHQRRGDELEKDRRALLDDKQALQTEKLTLLHEKTDLAGRLRDAEDGLRRLRDERLPRKAEYEEVRKRLGEVEDRARELEQALARKEATAAEKEELARHLQAGVEGLRRDLDEYDRKLRATTTGSAAPSSWRGCCGRTRSTTTPRRSAR